MVTFSEGRERWAGPFNLQKDDGAESGEELRRGGRKGKPYVEVDKKNMGKVFGCGESKSEGTLVLGEKVMWKTPVRYAEAGKTV